GQVGIIVPDEPAIEGREVGDDRQENQRDPGRQSPAQGRGLFRLRLHVAASRRVLVVVAWHRNPILTSMFTNLVNICSERGTETREEPRADWERTLWLRAGSILP